MRTIKFRAWDKYRKMMVTDFAMIPTSPHWSPSVIQYDKGQSDVINDYWKSKGDLFGGDYSSIDYSDFYASINYEVMQFTGLLDKDGKEIYEGDIVLLPDTESETIDVGIGVDVKVVETPVSSIAVVEFRNGSFGFDVIDGGECWPKGWIPLPCTDYTKFGNYEFDCSIELIGNKYENPELINKQ